MNVPEKSALPLISPDRSLFFDKNLIKPFNEAFGSPEESIPPTWSAIALQSIFDLLNQLQVDWKKLLHATQRFEYLSNPQIASALICKTQLTDIKLRGGIYWLNFESVCLEKESSYEIVKSKTLILVRTH